MACPRALNASEEDETSQTNASSDAPVSRRNRAFRSCQSCRLSKVKCSGMSSCERCRRRGFTCQYGDKEEPRWLKRAQQKLRSQRLIEAEDSCIPQLASTGSRLPTVSDGEDAETDNEQSLDTDTNTLTDTRHDWYAFLTCFPSVFKTA